MRKLFLLFLFLVPVILHAQLKYPETKKVDVSDNYSGTVVADPYRWLEDDNSEETKAWVKAENQVTNDYLSKISFRGPWLNRIEEISNYPKYSAPSKKQEYYYYSLNNGLQNQSVVFRQKGLDGTPEEVIDPNKFSKDGTTSLAAFSLSKDGRYAVVGKSSGGSDWRKYYVMDMQTLKYLDDSLTWIKASGVSWQGNGFYYSRYPAPDSGKELSTKNEYHQVFFHAIGTPQEKDMLVYEDKINPQRFHFVSTSEDERYAFLSISDRGKGKDGEALFYMDNLSADKKFKPLVSEITDDFFNVLDESGGKFLIVTNNGAKNRRVVLIDPQDPDPAKWKTIIPEKPESISNVATAGHKLFVTYLKDVTSRVYVFDYEGKFEKEVKLPALGTVGGFDGEHDDAFVFYTFTSFTFPPTIYKYDIATGQSTLFRKPEVKFDPEDFVTEQVFYPSKDGTKIPMFIVYKKGLVKNGKNPALLTGYGGFNISSNPGFSSVRISWLEQGGIYALTNLRGGSEYGEDWHKAGMRYNKQNVFDDFIATAEFLINKKYTSSDYLGITGGSNGGTLIGAVLNQRPDLFKVAVPQVGVMDMLRYQKFTIGWNWIAEYGNSDSAKDFKNLYAYSPLHNIKPGIKYPAILITTADHDDRVVPAHSFKYAATLQANYNGGNPMVIRIDTNSGHGSSNLKKGLELTSDIYSFLFYNMGLTPKFQPSTNNEKKAF